MSLLDNALEDCVFIDKLHTPDGEGGYDTQWVEGASFKAAVVLDQSIQAQRAMTEGVTGVYAVTVRRSVRLGYHEVFKRLRDGAIFRVVSKDDAETPKSAALDARTVKAEEWTL